MDKAPTRLWQHADLRKVITTNEEVYVYLDRHGCYTVAQRRGVNPRLCRSKSTKKAMRPQRNAVNGTKKVVNEQ
jgi:hypothetical protein